jgi:hypothetical protein
VLLRETEPTFEIADALPIITQIRAMIAEHGDAIVNGGVELVVRCASREFKADGDRLVKKSPMPVPPVRTQYSGNRF